MSTTTFSFPSTGIFADMRKSLRRLPRALLHVVGAAAVLCALGPTAINAMQTVPAEPMNDVAPADALADAEAAPAVPRSRCPGCGLVSAIRLTEATGELPAAYELTVRMRDGSVRTSSAATAGSWVVGDRIILVSGTSASMR